MPIPLAVSVKTRTREDRKRMAKDDRAPAFFHLLGFFIESTEVLRTETAKQDSERLLGNKRLCDPSRTLFQ
jgi:hypothetical protein